MTHLLKSIHKQLLLVKILHFYLKILLIKYFINAVITILATSN